MQHYCRGAKLSANALVEAYGLAARGHHPAHGRRSTHAGLVPMTVDAQGLLDLAVPIVRAAGELVRQGRAAALADVGRKSTPTDLVTAMDTAAERLVVERLRAVRPADAVLGEEGGGHEGASGVRWVLDPIDGTVNYVYGIAQYAVSLAAEVDGVVVAGVVLNPETGEEWTAVRGAGSYRDGRRLTASAVSTLDQAMLGTGFSYEAAVRAEQARTVAALLPRVRDIRRFGAAALDLCFVAEGRLDAYYEGCLNYWDRAAGGLVAEEAGALVTGLRGAAPGPAMTVAAPPTLHAALHDQLVELDAELRPRGR
jgi:myo-inositol-1(or 4)-monophosphatase